jgi:hypothetical protein
MGHTPKISRGYEVLQREIINKKRRGTNRNFLESYLAEFMWSTRLGKQDQCCQL